MKVLVLLANGDGFDEGASVVGVYTTKEKAADAALKYIQNECGEGVVKLNYPQGALIWHSDKETRYETWLEVEEYEIDDAQA